MPFIRAQVRIPRDTGQEEDVVTNTWHFDCDNGTAAACAAEIHGALEVFYQAIDVYLAGGLLGTPAIVRYYDLEEPPERVPVLEDDIALTMTGGLSYPPEVGIAMSFQGAQESGVNMRRRRGRLFLGPVLASTSVDSGGRCTVTSTVRSAIATAADTVMSFTGTNGISWAVYSPTTYAETNDLDAAMEDVVSGWVDDEYDIQRRRGTVPVARTTWS